VPRPLPSLAGTGFEYAEEASEKDATATIAVNAKCRSRFVCGDFPPLHTSETTPTIVSFKANPLVHRAFWTAMS
jgi:hypothetical protein